MSAKVLQLRLAIWANDIIGINGITASRAFAIHHQLALFERDFELLLVTVYAKQRWSQKDVCDHAYYRHQSDNSPDIPCDTSEICVSDHPNDG